jgi:NAD-dependent deacetylase
VVFFGEAIPWKAHLEAQEEAGNCEVMLVVGTSAVVSPACDLPLIAKRAGATIVEVNLEETQLTRHITDWILKGSASILLQALVNEIISAGQA